MTGNQMDAEEVDGYLIEQLEQSEALGRRYGVSR
jgi:hypothetical protein